jgi:hypothetical protein
MLTRRAMLGQVGAAASAAWAMRAGAAAGAAGRTAIDFDVPRGACDCHVHVFGDPAKFPFAEKRIYTPPQASIDELLELQRDLHLERVVVVQPSVYGTDNACTVDAVRRMGVRARGVAVIDKATPRQALEEMAAAGIRGVRLNLETNTAGRFDPADAKAVLDTTAEQIRGLNWHVQIYTRTSVIAASTSCRNGYRRRRCARRSWWTIRHGCTASPPSPASSQRARLRPRRGGAPPCCRRGARI